MHKIVPPIQAYRAIPQVNFTVSFALKVYSGSMGG